MVTVEKWARQQWGTAELGDKRRADRAVKMGTQMAAHPQLLLPGQMQSWGDLKSAYRLLHQDDVTHEALSLPHWRQTRQAAATLDGPVLFVQDDTLLDFTCRQIEGVGQVGDTKGRGLMVHSTLAVQPGNLPVVIGLAHQKVWARQGPMHGRKANRNERARRTDKESENWHTTLSAIGQAPEGTCWVSVGDSASDMFRHWRRARELGWECLLRVARDRNIVTEDGFASHVWEWLETLPAAAHETLDLRLRPDRSARTVHLSLAWGKTRILPPANDPFERGQAPQEVWLLRIWEEAPPVGEKPLEWVVLSTLPIDTEQQAHERAAWYRCRWLIEQYHKALKTGCRMEDSQLQQGDAVKRLLGFLSIVAVRLLQVETLARNVPDLPARQAVDPEMIEFVCRLRRMDAAQMTVYQFWREVAKFGGFLGRKRDGEPGWQTLWRGWNYLYPRFEGYLLGKNCG